MKQARQKGKDRKQRREKRQTPKRKKGRGKEEQKEATTKQGKEEEGGSQTTRDNTGAKAKISKNKAQRQIRLGREQREEPRNSRGGEKDELPTSHLSEPRC